ncbi:MAG: CMP-N-acetylneuraminic acid synthetase [Ferruginibacter sp.]|uniref:pseudaminic acid cytidylyltransferase n=1 Tax=Ferruginibacter sp. TaxID=1940288 RepID=UPI002657B8E7|nr:pseudaminic acid cytidylyltransferase [Ferruginibacter sp.]MDB5275549.1 CMP-N-acetylneuraminic acid synthetase [Ferruginibacter sp.]
MSKVAIITARGGSKRIPRKNIKSFWGKPILAYSIQTALASGLFEDVIVSTDDNEIASIAKEFGANVPFLRSEETAGDFSSTADVLLEVLRQLDEIGKTYNDACCIYPTAPFISTSILEKGYRLLKEGNYDSVFPVCAFSYPVMRSLKMEKAGKVFMQWPENIDKRSQDLPPFYHDAGQFYWINVLAFLEKQKLFTDKSGAVILNELQVQDIDNEMDWKIAELKYSLLTKVANG